MTDAELIEAVAIEVMGWHKDFLCREEYWFSTDAPFRYKRESVKDWNPLTDANHWMMVINKVSDIYGVAISRSLSGWLVCFQDVVKEHKSIGHAVCLAALEAVKGGKVK